MYFFFNSWYIKKAKNKKESRRGGSPWIVASLASLRQPGTWTANFFLPPWHPFKYFISDCFILSFFITLSWDFVTWVVINEGIYSGVDISGFGLLLFQFDCCFSFKMCKRFSWHYFQKFARVATLWEISSFLFSHL